MNKPIIILGAGSIGKSAMEAFISNDVLVYGFLDDDASLQGKEIGEVEVMGRLDDETYTAVIGKDCDAFIAIEEIELRRNLVQMLVDERKAMPVNAIHNNAVLATSAVIGHGNFIGAGVIIGSYTELQNHIIINPGATINHDVKLGNYVQIGAGSIINSGVQIEDDVFVGSGVTIVAGITIGSGARIGAGSVVIKNVDEGQTVFGNPAEPV
jgi:sugar O-acyltransferase (sialic acid O-acetyltransferase NeuD family)